MDAAMVLDTRPLADALDRSADAATGRAALERIVDAHPELVEELRDHELVRDGLIALACASRSLTNAVVNDAALVEPLRDEAALTAEQSIDGFRRSAERDDVAGDTNGAVLRRW